MARPHILVVDDEPHVTLVIEHAGRLWGYDVSSARSLTQGREFLDSHPDVNLLLLDVKLPDGSGLDFLEELRRSESGRDLPVIVLTGAGQDAVLKQAAGAGARCVTKPFSPSKLGRMVGEMLGSQPSEH